MRAICISAGFTDCGISACAKLLNVSEHTDLKIEIDVVDPYLNLAKSLTYVRLGARRAR